MHVRTMGAAVVSKESETLYEDSPLSFLSPYQVASRVSLEHNYSFGESVALDHQEECTSNTELAVDLVILIHHPSFEVIETVLLNGWLYAVGRL